KKAVERIAKIQNSGCHKRHTQSIVAEYAAERRTDNETNAETRAEQTEIAGALLRRADISNISICRRDVRPGDSRNDTPGKEPFEVRSQRHHYVIESRAEQRR